MRTTRILLLSALAVGSLVTSGAGAARAEETFPGNAVYVGAFGGGVAPLNGWDLGKGAKKDLVEPKSIAPVVGLRVGYQVIPQLGIELSGGWLPISNKNDKDPNASTSNTAFHFEVSALYHFLRGPWTPYVSVGAGMYYLADGPLVADADPRVHLGLGVRGLLAPNWAIRAEARGIATDGWSSSGAYLLEGTLGIDYFFGGPAEPVKPPPPAAPADKDKDGIPDATDKCPDVPGLPEFQGCPDTDKDGVQDSEDECPKDAGLKELKGCPDKDKDGIADAKDKCPDVAGVAEFEGCPDTDKDGVQDSEDRCPKEPGPKELKGCPDRDKDAIPDLDDKCPDEPGVAEFGGCLPPKAKKFTGSIKGINFKTGSADILPNSFKLLDEVVKVLKEFPTLRIKISGHTDNVGKADKNQKLSEDRAASVKKYLASKGIDENRFDSAGYGDTKPKADNKTDKGRADNRRIDFEIVTK
ncbi:MAG: OmpA family protein [Myxococcales bacterium]|nr:OmpA family protein [Myxococcales bacterium]